MFNLNQTLFVLCGSPGSGKTTYAHKLAKQHNAIIHSYDDMPKANTKQSMDGSVKRAWIENMKNDLKSGYNVVCDGMNLTLKERIEVLDGFSNIDCKKVLFVLRPELDVCIERNAQRESKLPIFVVKQAYNMYEHPTLDEMWDEIIFI
jgi:tRNA uridine 5-carbamoylmethylation protein Kti12